MCTELRNTSRHVSDISKVSNTAGATGNNSTLTEHFISLERTQENPRQVPLSFSEFKQIMSNSNAGVSNPPQTLAPHNPPLVPGFLFCQFSFLAADQRGDHEASVASSKLDGESELYRERYQRRVQQDREETEVPTQAASLWSQK